MMSLLRVARVALVAVALTAAIPCSAAEATSPDPPATEELPGEIGNVRQVRDLLTEQDPSLPSGWELLDFVRLGDRVLFSAYDGIHGWELWSTDGTSQGTALLKDICLGDCSSFPFELRRLLGHVYFEADDGDHGTAIWRSDGTTEGTEMVVDVPMLKANRKRGMYGPFYGPFLTEFRDALFFVADDRVHGPELWRSDGEPGGSAELVADILPGPLGSQPASLYVVEETLYFSADDGAHGRELWKSDGTQHGTELVKDMAVGPQDCLSLEKISPPAGPQFFAAAGDRLVFTTHSLFQEPCSSNLWASDGTAEGTRRILELQVAGPLFPFRAADGAVLLSARGGPEGAELWRTDGTDSGTYLVKDISEGPLGSSPEAVAASEGIVYFKARDLEHYYALWKTDGTAAGTTLVEDIDPGSGSGFHGDNPPRVPDPGARFAYFEANDGKTGFELWRSDGTPEGTFLLEDINPGEASAFDSRNYPVFAAELQGRLIFYAISAANRVELWSTNGFPGGTERLHQIDLQASAMVRGPFVTEPEIAAASQGVLFGAFRNHGGELWTTDGTEPGTRRIQSFCEPDCALGDSDGPWELTSVGHQVFFSAHTPNLSNPPTRLWVSDGSADGTRVVDTVPSIQIASSLVEWTGSPEQPRLVFTDFFFGRLYVSDGTLMGTHHVTPDYCDSYLVCYVENSTPAGDRVFFSFDWKDTELWVSEGAAGDAHRVLDIFPGREVGSEPGLVTPLGDRVVFSAEDGVAGREVWVSDGTAAGTRLLRDIRPGLDSSIRSYGYGGFTATSRYVYFPADDGVSGEELWRTDGTPGGTTLVADLNPGPESSDPRPWVASGSTLFFSAWDSVHGRELWQTDTETLETRLVTDLDPGPDSGVSDIPFHHPFWTRPRPQPVIWKGRLYFAGTDGNSGVELWSTDGTAWGTRRVADIHPGSGSSSPRGFTPFDSKLFFSATDGVTGFEMWVVESSISTRGIFFDGFESGDTSAWSSAEH